MDPRDRLRTRIARSSCTACGARFAPDRIRIVAERDDLVVVRAACPGCGSETLGLVALPLDGSPGGLGAELGPGPARFGEFGPTDEARLAGRPPVGTDDLLEMHTFLATFQGDLRELSPG